MIFPALTNKVKICKTRCGSIHVGTSAKHDPFEQVNTPMYLDFRTHPQGHRKRTGFLLSTIKDLQQQSQKNQWMLDQGPRLYFPRQYYLSMGYTWSSEAKTRLSSTSHCGYPTWWLRQCHDTPPLVLDPAAMAPSGRKILELWAGCCVPNRTEPGCEDFAAWLTVLHLDYHWSMMINQHDD